jgi:hypothetical protein
MHSLRGSTGSAIGEGLLPKKNGTLRSSSGLGEPPKRLTNRAIMSTNARMV